MSTVVPRIAGMFCVFVALLACTVSADATPVTIRVETVISRIWYADCVSYSESGSCNQWSFTDLESSDFANGQLMQVGDPLNGSFQYDTDAPLTAISEDGYQGIYLYSVDDYDVASDGWGLPSDWLPRTGFDGNLSVVDGRGG